MRSCLVYDDQQAGALRNMKQPALLDYTFADHQPDAQNGNFVHTACLCCYAQICAYLAGYLFYQTSD